MIPWAAAGVLWSSYGLWMKYMDVCEQGSTYVGKHNRVLHCSLVQTKAICHSSVNWVALPPNILTLAREKEAVCWHSLVFLCVGEIEPIEAG